MIHLQCKLVYMYGAQCTLVHVQCILVYMYSVHWYTCTLYSVHCYTCTVYNGIHVQCTTVNMYSVQCTVYTGIHVQCSLVYMYSVHWYNVQRTLVYPNNVISDYTGKKKTNNLHFLQNRYLLLVYHNLILPFFGRVDFQLKQASCQGRIQGRGAKGAVPPHRLSKGNKKI